MTSLGKPLASAVRMSLAAIGRFVSNPFVNLTTGFVLIYTATSEIIDSAEETGVGAEHGILVFGIIHALGALPEVVHGFEELLKSDEEAEDTRQSH